MFRPTRIAQTETVQEQVSEILSGATAFFMAAAVYVAIGLAL